MKFQKTTLLTIVMIIFSLFVFTSSETKAATWNGSCPTIFVDIGGELECYVDGGLTPSCISSFECCTPGWCNGRTGTCTVESIVSPQMNERFESIEYGDDDPGLGCSDTGLVATDELVCWHDRCPTSLPANFDGGVCTVRKINPLISDQVWYNTGVWDVSEDKCVQCTGSVENVVCGGAAGMGLAPGGACVNAGDGQCESACGANPICDEEDPFTGVCMGGASGCQLTICDNNGTCAGAETTANCPNDCCVNKTCADPAVCSDAVNCLTLEPACVGFCIAASAACDPDCGMWECDNSGFVEQCPTPGVMKDCSNLDGDTCIGGTYQNCDNGCTLNNAPICWNGAGGCGVIPPGSCVDEYDACGCDCVAGGCNNDGVQNNGETGVDCGGGGCPACACTTIWDPWSACTGAPGTQTSSNTGTCVVPDKSQLCCDDDSNCVVPSPFCNALAGPAGQCVQCITSDDCAGTDVCDNGFCIPCSDEGEDPGDADLCCVGLSYLNLDDDGSFICTSACDPDAWFFCNPLRGSVETIVEAGETMLGYILGLIGSVSLLFIIIAGMMYMTSAGNEERISSSKRILSGAVVGLMIALLAYGLLHVIMTVLGM